MNVVGTVVLYRDGKKSESSNGSLLHFTTRKSEDVVVVRKGSTPQQYERSVME